MIIFSVSLPPPIGVMSLGFCGQRSLFIDYPGKTGGGVGGGGVSGVKLYLSVILAKKWYLSEDWTSSFRMSKWYIRVFLKVSEANFRLRHLKNVFLEGKNHHKHSYFPKIFACGA